MKSGVQKIAKAIILEELEENIHPEKVEDVIFWALEAYSKRQPATWGVTIAYNIVERIKAAESDYQTTNN